MNAVVVSPNHLPARSTDPATSWLAAEVDPEGRKQRARFWIKRALTVAFPEGATDYEIRLWADREGCPYPMWTNRLATERGQMCKEGLVVPVPGVRRPTGTGHLAQVWKWVGA